MVNVLKFDVFLSEFFSVLPIYELNNTTTVFSKTIFEIKIPSMVDIRETKQKNGFDTTIEEKNIFIIIYETHFCFLSFNRHLTENIVCSGNAFTTNENTQTRTHTHTHTHSLTHYLSIYLSLFLYLSIYQSCLLIVLVYHLKMIKWKW